MLLSVEGILRSLGYTQPEVRRLVALQVLVALSCCVAALVTGGLSAFMWSLAAGALLATVNFASLARFAQHLPYVQGGAVTALLIRFYGRLALTGLALFGLIVCGGASITGLLLGLSTVLVTAMFWGLARFGGNNVKEA